MSRSCIRRLIYVIVISAFATVVSAQSAPGLSDREVRTIRNEIYALDQRIAQLLRQGQPISAELRAGVLERFFAYSPALSDKEVQLAFDVVRTLGRISEQGPLSKAIIDDVIGWMLAKGWGTNVLVQSSQNGSLDSAQFERLVDGLLARDPPLDAGRIAAVEQLIEEGERPATDLDLLGERLLGLGDATHRRLLINWLLIAIDAKKLEQSPVAARALLLNADSISYARVRLEPLIAVHSDPEILRHISELAVENDSEDLTDLLMSVELPDDILLSLQPLASSSNSGMRSKVAYAIARQFSAKRGGAEWLLKTSKDQAAPQLLRRISIKELAGKEATPVIREVLLEHYSGDVPALRVEALRALRHYDLARETLEAATVDADPDIRREGWLQMEQRFDVNMPLQTKWQLYPHSQKEDIGVVFGLVTAASAAVMVLTALVTPILAGKLWTSLALFLTGAAASLASWGIVIFLTVASQHSNAFADPRAQQLLFGTVIILWFLIGMSWFIAIRVQRR